MFFFFNIFINLQASKKQYKSQIYSINIMFGQRKWQKYQNWLSSLCTYSSTPKNYPTWLVYNWFIYKKKQKKISQNTMQRFHIIYNRWLNSCKQIIYTYLKYFHCHTNILLRKVELTHLYLGSEVWITNKITCGIF